MARIRMIRYGQAWFVLALLWITLIGLASWPQISEHRERLATVPLEADRWSRIAPLVRDECKATLAFIHDVSPSFRDRCRLFAKDHEFYLKILQERALNSALRLNRIWLVIAAPPALFGVLGAFLVLIMGLLDRGKPTEDESDFGVVER